MQNQNATTKKKKKKVIDLAVLTPQSFQIKCDQMI